MVIALIALFAAVSGGIAVGAVKIKTKDIANQAVTNKKIKKKTIKANRVEPDTLTGNQINEASLRGAGTARSIREDIAAQVPGGVRADVLTLRCPRGAMCSTRRRCWPRAVQSPVQCFLSAGGDQDRSLEAVDAANNTTITNLLVHTFPSAGAVTLACDNPGGALFLVTNKVITATPVGAISSSTLP